MSLADEAVLGEGEALLARAAMLAVSTDAIAMEKRMAAMNAKRLCLRDILFSWSVAEERKSDKRRRSGGQGGFAIGALGVNPVSED